MDVTSTLSRFHAVESGLPLVVFAGRIQLVRSMLVWSWSTQRTWIGYVNRHTEQRQKQAQNDQTTMEVSQ
jgi:hypothetical protein